MKLIAKVRKQPEITFFLLCYSGFLVFLIGSIFPRYLTWQALPKPPEPIEKLFYIWGNQIVVTSTSGNRFSCNIYDVKECWVVDPYNREEWLPQCGEDFLFLNHQVLSTKHTVQSAQSCGFLHNFAISVTAYSLNDDKLVYVKEISWVTLQGYNLGAAFSIIGAMIFYFVRIAVLDVIYMFQKEK